MAYKGGSSKTSTKINFESFYIIFDCRYQSNICNSRQAVFIATGKINLELARKVLTHRISDKEPSNCFSIRRSVKCLICTNTSEMTAHYISDGISTGFSSCKAYFNQAPHYFANVF